MISLDPYIIKFVAGNVIALTLFLALLKGIAKMIPGVLDDKIVTMLQGLFRLVPKPDKTDKGNILISVLMIIFLVTFLAGCGMTYKKAFLTTHKTFNEMVKDYKAYYLSVDKDTQAKLNADVTPKVLDALTLSIEINKVVTAGGDASTVDKDRFRDLRYQLYALLPKIFSLED